MFFILLLSLVTASIAGAAAFFSIYGLAQIFSGTFWAVVFMGSSLEAGKLVAASFLYRYWNKITTVLKIYLTVAVVVLMLITSMGIFGFLSASYQQDSLPLKEMQVKIDGLKQEQQQLTSRKTAIDTARQSAVTAAVNNQSTRSRVVNSKERLAKTYDGEIKDINKRLPILTKEIQELDQKVLTTQLHTGPITYIAKALGRDIDDATKWVIFMLIVAFDPLAVALTIGVNIVINIVKSDKDQAEQIAFEKVRQDKSDELERERQARIDAREEVARKWQEELEDMRANIQHEREMATLLGNSPELQTPEVVTPPIEEPAAKEVMSIEELAKLLDDLSSKKELTPVELATKQHLTNSLSKQQLLESIRLGSTNK